MEGTVVSRGASERWVRPIEAGQEKRRATEPGRPRGPAFESSRGPSSVVLDRRRKRWVRCRWVCREAEGVTDGFCFLSEE